MYMTPFLRLFPDLAMIEMRTATVEATVQDVDGLPDGNYGFFELYCDDPECDCRRVMINVISRDTGAKVWATINFGWEDSPFYRAWSHDAPDADKFAGASLDPLNAQTRHSPTLLALFNLVLEDAAYIARLKSHYQMFKAALPQKKLSRAERRQNLRAAKRHNRS